MKKYLATEKIWTFAMKNRVWIQNPERKDAGISIFLTSLKFPWPNSFRSKLIGEDQADSPPPKTA